MEHERAVQNLAVECYLLGEMTDDQREDFEAHYFECAVCADDLRSASQFIEEAKDIFASDPAQRVRARIASEPRPAWRWLNWLQPQFAMAAIAVLVVVVGVESLSTIPSLERRLADVGSARIVNPTYLKAQVRGNAPLPNTVAGESAVFIFDLPESSPPEVQFVVKSADGKEAFRISKKAPERGEQVMLTIPKVDLPEGSYTLAVEAATANGQEGAPLGLYPFEIKH